MENIRSILEIVVLAASIGVSTFALLRWLSKNMMRATHDRLTQIEQHLKPNHGSSLRDAVDRVDARLNEIDARLERLDDFSAEHSLFHAHLNERRRTRRGNK